MSWVGWAALVISWTLALYMTIQCTRAMIRRDRAENELASAVKTEAQLRRLNDSLSQHCHTLQKSVAEKEAFIKVLAGRKGPNGQGIEEAPR